MQFNTVTKKERGVQRNKISDDVLIKGILNNNSKIIRQIYLENYEKIKVMVLDFKYYRSDPEDVFQEGLRRAIMNIRKGAFKSKSGFSTYLYGICRNICLNEYNKKKKENKEINPVSDENFEDSNQEENDYFELLQQIVKLKNDLNRKCQEIIDLRFNLNDLCSNNKLEKFENIAIKLGIKADNARQRFMRCLANFKKIVLNNPDINRWLS